MLQNFLIPSRGRKKTHRSRNERKAPSWRSDY